MDEEMIDLFGRGSKEGLLHWLHGGTLLLNNIHNLKPAAIPLVERLIKTGTYQPALPVVKALQSMDMLPPPTRQFTGRILLSAEKRTSLESLVTTIQVGRAHVLEQAQGLLREGLGG
jgi:hypothetical protein